MSEEANPAISRRTFVGAAALGVGAVALGGGSTAAAALSKTSSPAASTPKRGGTFRVGLSDSSSFDTIDPLYSDYAFASVALCRNLYDRLMTVDLGKPSISNQLAEEMTSPPNLKYYDVRLRKAEWHNGKPVTADDVIYTLKRILNPKAPGSAASALTAIDPKRLQKLDSRTVRIHLRFPDASIPTVMAQTTGTSIVPVGFNPKKPIGSGPFRLKSFNPGKLTTLVRSNNFWEAGRPYLDALEFVGFADPGTTRLNALVTGQIDGADHIDPTLVRTIDGRPSLKVLVSPSAGFHIWEMKTTAAPFNDVRVRQAIRLLADRQQIVQQALGGTRFARVGNDLPSIQDPLYARSIPQRSQDIEQARFLLKQAGQEGLTVSLTVSNVTPGAVQTAQVLRENARAAGVTININQISDTATYWAKHFAQDPFKFNYYQTVPLFYYSVYGLIPGSPYNVSDYNDPKFTTRFKAARATKSFTKQKALMAEAQRILWDSGSQGIFAFNRTLEAHSAKFAGIRTDLWGYSLNQLRYHTVYVR